MSNKIVSADDAVAAIRAKSTVSVSGFVGVGTPDELLLALERRYTTTGKSGELTLVFAAAPGDGKDRGLNRLAHPGLVRRAIGGHWSLVPKLGLCAMNGEIEAYNLPLGCISQLYRDIAAHRPGLLSKVGLRTFVDPRLGGGKINDRTTEDLVSPAGGRWRGVPAVQDVPDRRRHHSRHHRRHRRQHHHGARGAAARRAAGGDGGA